MVANSYYPFVANLNQDTHSGGLRLGGGDCAKHLGGVFPVWSTQKSSVPFHAQMLWQQHISCASV